MNARAMTAVSLFVMVVCGASAASDGGFAVTVLHDDKPVREITEGEKRRAAIPFDAEYELRLRNTHGRRATARVFIDDAPVSKMGDFVVPENGTLNLERFLDASLDEGKRFRFVRLTHPGVDDPDRSENGLVRVEFRLEKHRAIQVVPPAQHWPLLIWIYTNSYTHCYGNVGIGTSEPNTILHVNNADMTLDCYMNSTTLCSATMPGATVGGGLSQQGFSRVDIDTEDECVVVELWLRGIDHARRVNVNG